MKNRNAIVTMAVGEKYWTAWKRDCELNWQEYAGKHGYDLICLEKLLDMSERAQKRSPSWQKCLILSQDFSSQYEQIVWIDSDILINTHSAPSIVEHVPKEKVGAVELFCYSKQAGSAGREALKRMYDYWKLAIINPEPEDYYTKYGLPHGFDTVVQAGMMVFSPLHHRAIMEKVYYQYEEKGGPEWHYEMRPLSYEFLKAGIVHWIDPRFNLLWLDCVFLHYPFLINPPRPRSFLVRALGRAERILGNSSRLQVRRACLAATFLNSYFLHFGGSELNDMQLLDTGIDSWLECRI
jgi:hypothetical protein